MSGALSHHLFEACKEFFKATNAAKVPAVLIGGGALGLHHLLVRRSTKDLDLNVGREILTQAFKSSIRIVPKKTKHDERGTWLWREDPRKDEIRVHATFLSGGMHDVSFDIKVPHPDHPEQQQVLDTLVTFSLNSEGIRYADLGPLVATKTLAVVRRGIGQVEKHKSDIEDFEMTIMAMIERKQKMPKQVIEVLLTPTVLQDFLKLKLVEHYDTFFMDIDVEVNKQQSQQASSARIDAVGSDEDDNQG